MVMMHFSPTDGSSEPFDAEIPGDLWLDMQAFAAATGITIDELIRLALQRYFDNSPATKGL